MPACFLWAGFKYFLWVYLPQDKNTEQKQFLEFEQKEGSHTHIAHLHEIFIIVDAYFLIR